MLIQMNIDRFAAKQLIAEILSNVTKIVEKNKILTIVGHKKLKERQ